MIICPNCHHQELTGAIFCSECGSQLVVFEHIETQLFGKIGTGGIPPQKDSDLAEGTPPLPELSGTSISLYLVDSGQILHLVNRLEYSLGRMSEGQPITPDVDFSPYDAYTQGVSRLHASLKVIDQHVVLTDLGSSNGTRVNGKKVLPHIDYPITHGDIISLGRLKVQILVRNVHEKG